MRHLILLKMDPPFSSKMAMHCFHSMTNIAANFRLIADNIFGAMPQGDFIFSTVMYHEESVKQMELEMRGASSSEKTHHKWAYDKNASRLENVFDKCRKQETTGGGDQQCMVLFNLCHQVGEPKGNTRIRMTGLLTSK